MTGLEAIQSAEIAQRLNAKDAAYTQSRPFFERIWAECEGDRWTVNLQVTPLMILAARTPMEAIFASEMLSSAYDAKFGKPLA